MLEQIDSLSQKNSSLQSEVAMLKAENVLLNARLDWLNRQIYGQKRERYIPEESQTILELGVDSREVVVSETQVPAHTRKSCTQKPLGHGRDELPAHLPRVQKHIVPDYDTTGMEHIRDAVTEELHYKEPEFYVVQTIRPVHVKIDENGLRTPVCPELAPRCIDKGNAGASMVAQTITAKVIDHTALFHFQKQIKRICGYDVAYATLNDWFARGVFWLEPIALRLHQMLLESGYVQMDETTLRVIITPSQGKSHQGYMHVCNSPELKIVSFQYFNTRNQKIVHSILGEHYQGIVQTDGLDIYNFLDTIADIVHAGCHAHARRGFEEQKSSDGKRVTPALDMWQSLFEIERDARDKGLSTDERLKLRRERSQPIIDELKGWIDTTIVELTPKDPLKKALLYTLSRWKQLTRFLCDGRIELSNNLIENRIRPLAQGRKNWLFSKSEAGARRLAIAQTVLRTCELHGINPFDYLCDVLEKMPGRKANDIDDLLPMNWVAPAKE